jgi:hypothetical protein
MQRQDGTSPPIDADGIPFSCLCSRTCSTDNAGKPSYKQFTDTTCNCPTSDDCNYNCDLLQQSRLKQLMTANVGVLSGRRGPGIFLSDPDYLDNGFSALPFEVNISVVHGRVLLNEAFISQPDVFDVRIKVKNYPGFSNPQEVNTKGL